MIKSDIERVYRLQRGRRLRRLIGCCRSIGLHAVINYRFGHWLLNKSLFVKMIFMPWYLVGSHRMRKWGIDLPRTARIGEGLYIGHYGGIIVSGMSVIGRNVSISPQVTIGVAGKGDARGVPYIGDNVYIGPGAKVYGRITVGNNVKIGANAVVYKDVPENSTIVALSEIKG